jgi:glycine/D-amino acid oxidase-like deaminating enzyme
MPADGRSAIGPVPGLSGYYLIFTHSGVTLGPLLGKLAAAEILGGHEVAQLTPFRPDRLVQAV